MPDNATQSAHPNAEQVIEARLQRWRLELALRHGLLKRELDELEDHVRAELDNADVCNSEHALEQSLVRLGDSKEIARELRRSRRFVTARVVFGIAVMLAFSIGLLALTFRYAFELFFGTLVDLWSIAWIGGLTIGGLLVSYRPATILRTMAICSHRQTADGIDDLIDAAGVLGRGRQLALASGVVGSLVGIITMLIAVADFEAIGAGIGVGLISMLYGLLLAEFFFAPILHTVQQRRDQIDAAAALS
ncbi:MAG: MotA/TolQ/ExbB proton channel family protein [Planctomycetota bacterium]